MIRLVEVDGADPRLIDIARELFLEYQAGLGIDLCFQSFEEELSSLPGKYGPPSGKLLVVFNQDHPLACGAIRPLEAGVAEIKRIYVRPEGRRRGLAREISTRLIDFAREQGYERVRLDTLARLSGAVELYRSLGFVDIPAYNFNPEEDIVYMELRLSRD